MSQGNSGQFSADDGVWQDGALFFRYPLDDQWVAFFSRSSLSHSTPMITPATPSQNVDPGPTPSDPDRQSPNRRRLGEPHRPSTGNRSCHAPELQPPRDRPDRLVDRRPPERTVTPS